MGERQGWLFEPTFNRSIKIRQADPRVSDNGGTLLLREADHRLGLTAGACQSPRILPGSSRPTWQPAFTPVEMLQVFIRPEQADLPPHVEFGEREAPVAGQGWELVAGPVGSEALLTIRQRVMVLDAQVRAGEELSVPVVGEMVPWAYVLHGEVTVGGYVLEKGDSVLDVDAPLPSIHAGLDTRLVAFLVDLHAPATRAGTISRQ